MHHRKERTELYQPIETVILPLPMFLELSDVLLLVKLVKDGSCDLVLPEIGRGESTARDFQIAEETNRARNDFV